jgi:hypothetical protein
MGPSKFLPRAQMSRGKNGGDGRQLTRFVVGKCN